MRRAYQALRKALMIVGGLGLLAMMLHITAEVVLRATLGVTLPGTIEFVSFYYMVGVVFVGLALVVLVNEQVIVEIFLNWLPARPLSIVDAFGAILGATYAAVIAYATWLEAKSATRFGEMVPVFGMDMPIWPSRWIAVAAFVFIALASLGYAIAYLLGRKVPRP